MVMSPEVPSRVKGSWPTHSHSSQVSLTTCEKRFWFEKVARLEALPSKAMSKGLHMHQLLAVWWAGGSWEAEHKRLVQEWRDNHPMIDEATGELTWGLEPDWHDDMVWLMSRYVEFYGAGREQLEVVAIERPFKVQVPRKYAWFTGRTDMLVRDSAGRLWVVEWKTMSDWDSLEQYVWSPQLSLYFWAAWADKELGERPYGILLDALRTYRWKNPRPLEDSFRRRWLDRGDEQLDHTVAELAAGMVRARDIRKGAYPLRNVDRHCGWCAYREPCRGELAFGDESGPIALVED